MERSKVVSAVLSAILILSGPVRAENIELYTFASPPYQVVSDIPGPGTDVRGLTVDTVRCAITGAGWQSRVHAAPQKRATQFLIDNLIDGYFAIDPSTSLDQVAFRTNPVSLEKWHLVSRPDSESMENPRIGAIIGSNEEAWLRSQGRDIFLTVRTAEQLIALLHRGRIDQALMDQRVLETLNDTDNLRSRFLRYVPLHIYFSSRFVHRNPEFIDAFNRQITGCIDHNFDLDEAETAHIRATAYGLIRELEARLPLTAAIESGPAITSLSEILNLDAQWQALAPQQYSDMAKRIAEQPASIVMNDWQKGHKSLVTEVMLTNSIGTLVAMSRLTSDFWQGDEPKFERHIRGDTPRLYVSPIRYDASTSRFQVTVSLPVIDKGRWLPVGTIVIGLDIEEALAREYRSRYLARSPAH